MKKLISVLWFSTLLAVSALGDPVAQITLGEPKRKTYPATKDMSGFTLIEFPARLTNTSQKSIWFFSLSEDDQFYEAFVRMGKSRGWHQLPYARCGVGGRYYEIAPGKSAAFTTIAPAEDVGHHYRIGLSIYTSIGDRPTSIDLKSKEVSILPR